MQNETTITAAIDELVAKIGAEQIAVNTLCRLAGRPELYANADSVPAIGAAGGATWQPEPDAFFGKKLGPCIKKILDERGRRPATIDDIADTVKAGGYRFAGGNMRFAVQKTLTKGVRMFVKVPPNLYGLRSWYPSVRTSGKQPATVSGEPTTNATSTVVE